MSKRSNKGLKDRDRRPAKRPKTRSVRRAEEKDLYHFVRSLEPLLPDLTNLMTEYLSPCDYLVNPYGYCFSDPTAPNVRDINIDSKRFNIGEKCCRDRCLDLLELITNPPSQFLIADQKTSIDLGIPLKVRLRGDNPSGSIILLYDNKSNLFSDGPSSLVWSDIQTACDALQTYWPLQLLEIQYSRDWSDDNSLGDYNIIIDRQYGLRWSVYKWLSWIRLVGE